MKSDSYKSGLEKLRGFLLQKNHGSEYDEIVAARDSVIARFQPVFTLESVKTLEPEKFKPFLLFENNHHWPLQRQGGRICSNMNQLRSALAVLLDEQKPIAIRWNSVVKSVPGMGKAIMSAILLTARPERYGVWNNTSEGGLKTLGLWPELNQGTSSGEQYEAANTLLNQLAKDLQTDLWTLDALFYWMKDGADNGSKAGGSGTGGAVIDDQQSFGLEKHLHDFLFENWDKTELGKEWALYSPDDDLDTAYEYPTDVGVIDLLAKHLKEPRWLVVELKRGQTSDDTVGQVLRYTGWIKRNLAKPKEKVEGLIIARSVDDKLRYAVSEVPHVKLMEYQVSFHLHAAKSLDAAQGQRRSD
jgi:hypothetical protein